MQTDTISLTLHNSDAQQHLQTPAWYNNIRETTWEFAGWAGRLRIMILVGESRYFWTKERMDPAGFDVLFQVEIRYEAYSVTDYRGDELLVAIAVLDSR